MTTSEPIRVLIADDHGVVREGLRGLLIGAGLEVVGTAATGREALEKAESLQPDVVLLDIRMPDMDGLQALAAIKSSSPAISVLMLTTYANSEYLMRAISFGAAGYLTKEVNPERIPQAVMSVAAGENIVDHALLRGAVSRTSGPAEVDLQNPIAYGDDLTEQETRILKSIAAGLSNDRIAKLFSISRNTVKTHVRHIFEKLHVSDRTQAAIWAIRHGFVD